MRTVGSTDDSAFWWQWPCKWTVRASSVKLSGAMFPRSASRATNSSSMRQCGASALAAPRSPDSTRDGYSSRKPRIAEGSMPTSGASSVTMPDSSRTLSSANFRARRMRPFEIEARPLSAWRGRTTS